MCFACRVLKVILVQMALVDLMVNQEKMDTMDLKEILVIEVILDHEVQKEHVSINLGLLDLKVKQETKE